MNLHPKSFREGCSIDFLGQLSQVHVNLLAVIDQVRNFCGEEKFVLKVPDSSLPQVLKAAYRKEVSHV